MILRRQYDSSFVSCNAQIVIFQYTYLSNLTQSAHSTTMFIHVVVPHKIDQTIMAAIDLPLNIDL